MMTPAERASEIIEFSLHLERALDCITYLIAATPTGAERNKFCDAQIHLMAAQTIMSGKTK